MTMDNIFNESDVIFKYSRKQAIEDGVLVDISSIAKEAGILFPVAVTRSVFSILEDTSAPGQDFQGRAWDMLMIFRMEARKCQGDEIHFAPLFVMNGKTKPEPVAMWAKCGPGDDMAPVVTIMLEGED
jgi:hypothetical protein